VEQSVTIST